MVKKVQQLDETPVDVFEAIKRARMRMGFVRRRGVRAAAVSKSSSREPEPELEESTEDETPKNAMLNNEGVAVLMPEEDPEILVNLTQNSHEDLISASTVFPLTLFPHTISVDREKLTIAARSFFRVASVNSIPITDVQSVEVDVGPFFGTVKVTSKYFVNNQREIRYLWREEATKIHHLLQGLILAHQRHVDINTLDKEQLLLLLSDLGQGIAD